MRGKSVTVNNHLLLFYTNLWSLDKTIERPLKTCFNRALYSWMEMNLGKSPTLSDLMDIYGISALSL